MHYEYYFHQNEYWKTKGFLRQVIYSFKVHLWGSNPIPKNYLQLYIILNLTGGGGFELKIFLEIESLPS